MEYGSNIPRARRLLEQLLQTQGLDELQRAMVKSALSMMRRSPAVRITPVRNPRITATKRREIVRLANTTNLSAQQIANLVGCNHGRVSEVLQGRR